MDLRIYSVILETIGMLKTEMDAIGRKDRDLENQMRRAAASMALNVSEGSCSQGKNVRARFHTAFGSARETLACIEVAVALGYVASIRPEIAQRMGHIIGTLRKLVR